MFNKKISGHGTIKKLRTGAVISTLALSFMGGVVSADEVAAGGTTAEVVTANNEEKPAEVKEVFEVGTSVVAEELPTFEVTSELLAEAASDVAKAEDSVTEASALVEGTRVELAKAEVGVVEADKALAEVSSVTAEMVEEATKDAKVAEAEVSKLEVVATETGAEVTKLENEVAKQTEVVAEARAELSKAESAVEALSGGVNVPALEAVADTKEKAFDNASKAYNLEVELANNKERALETAKAELKKADSAVEATAGVLNTAKTQEADLTKQLEAARKELKNTPHYSEVPKLVIPEGYADLLRRYFAEGKPEVISTQLADMGYEALKANGFVGLERTGTQSMTYDEIETWDKFAENATEYERNHQVDVNNLSLEDRIHLTTYTAELINQIRDVFGTERVVANLDAIEIANQVAKLSTKQDRGHDQKALYDAGEPYGLYIPKSNVVTKDRSNLDENIAFSHNYISGLSELKSLVKRFVLTSTLFDGLSDWGHAVPITNINTSAVESQEKYLGTSYKSSNIYKVVARHNFVSDRDLLQAERNGYTKKFNTENNVYYKDANNQSKATVERIASLEAQLTTAQANVVKAQEAYNEAKADQANARETLSTLSSKVVDVEGAKAKLDMAKAELEVARENLALAKTSEAGRAEALTKATNARTLAGTALGRAEGTLGTLQDRLARAKEVNDGIVRRLAEAKTTKLETAGRVVTLTKAFENKEATIKEMTARKEALLVSINQLKTRLDTEELTLTERKAILDVLVSEYEGYKALAKEQAKVEVGGTTDTTETTENKGNDTIDNVKVEVVEVTENSNGTIELTTTEKPAENKEVKQALVENKKSATSNGVNQVSTPTYSRVDKQSMLPKTNSTASVSLTLLGALLTMLGLTGYRRKEN